MLAIIQYRIFCHPVCCPKKKRLRTKELRIIFPVVLYGCDTWSPTLREECRLREFGNRVLSKIFGPKMDKVTGVEKIT
jgi:hypothetical protein